MSNNNIPIINTNEEDKESSLVLFLTKSFTSQVISTAFEYYYQTTGLRPSISLSYNTEQGGTETTISFLPRKPTEQEYELFLVFLSASEKIIVGNSFINYVENIDEIEKLKELEAKFKKEVHLNKDLLIQNSPFFNKDKPQ